MIKNNPAEYVTVGMIQDQRRKEWLARPVMRHDLGSIPGTNRPSDIMSANRAANWRDFTALLAACCVLTFGWMIVGAMQ